MYDPDDCLMISGLQHFRFCRRQWALIYIEQQWAENLRTTEGALLHERAHDEQFRESRGDTIITRSLRVYSLTLGLSGQCDVVEFHRDEHGVPLHGYEGTWLPYPVEYKRGHAKQDGCDELQLCAQAMCLEEMLGRDIPEGAIFYGQPRRRERVLFDARLRAVVTESCAGLHALLEGGRTPPGRYGPRCRGCSLLSRCMPKAPRQGVEDYLLRGLLS